MSINTINTCNDINWKRKLLQSTVTRPKCGHQKEETMPTDACQYSCECESCQGVNKPLEGDCCMYSSYETTVCPAKQNGSCDC